jgi:tetrahydromethanopterin S-methyltransferase subunit G
LLRNVEPKRQRLRESTQTLEKVNAELALTKAELQKVVNRLSELEEKFNNAVAEKDRLTNQVRF